MFLIISGSRHISDYALLQQAIKESGFVPSCIIHGDATGVDRLGSRYATEHSIPELKYPADWLNNGKAAGPIRNSAMISFVKGKDAGLLSLWDGSSRGSFDCIKKAFDAKLPIYVKCPIN